MLSILTLGSPCPGSGAVLLLLPLTLTAPPCQKQNKNNVQHSKQLLLRPLRKPDLKYQKKEEMKKKALMMEERPEMKKKKRKATMMKKMPPPHALTSKMPTRKPNARSGPVLTAPTRSSPRRMLKHAKLPKLEPRLSPPELWPSPPLPP